MRQASPLECPVSAGETGERGGNSAVVTEEPTIRFGKSQEALQLFLGLWEWPINDGRDLCWIHLDAILGNDVAEEGHRRGVKVSFLHHDE